MIIANKMKFSVVFGVLAIVCLVLQHHKNWTDKGIQWDLDQIKACHSGVRKLSPGYKTTTEAALSAPW